MMRSIRHMICALALLASSPAGQSTGSNKMNATAADEAKVMEVINGFNAAFAANDPEKYFSYIDEGITVITPSNPYRVDGIADDREEFEHSLRRGVSRVGFFQELQPNVQLFGDAAVVTYYSRGSYGPEGQQKVAYYKETDVLARRGDRWKIVHIHVSATQ